MTRPIYEQDITIIVSPDMTTALEQWCDRYAEVSQAGLTRTEQEHVILLNEQAALLGRASAMLRELRNTIRSTPPAELYPLPSRRATHAPRGDSRPWPGAWGAETLRAATAGINPLGPLTPTFIPRDIDPLDQLGAGPADTPLDTERGDHP